jgi:hypothetical protein
VRSPVRARQNRDLGRPGKEKPSERTTLPVQPDYIPCGQKSFDLLYRGTRVARSSGKRWLPPLQNLSVCFTLILLPLSYPVCLSLGMRKELPANVSDAIPVPGASELSDSEKAGLEFFVSLARLAHQGLEFRFVANLL